MKKKLTATALLLCAATLAGAQKVYSTDKEYRADVKVYVTKYEQEADLVVYKADKEYESGVDENRGVWLFVEKEYRADKKVCFVDYKSRADLVVCFTDKKHRAQWRNAAKRPLMY